MADNFNLRQFLSENKLTKNTKLLSENTDIAQAFSQAGITGEVTIAFHSEHGMSEPEFEVMNAQDALAMIASEAEGAEDVIIAQGDEIDQQGDYEEETKGLECKLEVAILDHGTYEVYQGSNSVDEAAPATMQAGFDMVNAEAKRHKHLMKIANELFPEHGGDLENFKPLSQEQRNQVYAQYTKELKEGTDYDPDNEEWESDDDYPGQTRYVNRRDIEEGKSYKVSKNSKEAQHLKKGDIIGSGDEVVSVSAGAKTPSGKVEVTLKTKDGKTKTSTWGKTTKVGVKEKETVKENTMNEREQYLTRLVENALGMQPSDDGEIEFNPADIADEEDYRRDQYLGNQMEEGEEMAQETVIPEYKTIEELMKNIDHGTNKVAEEHKMQEMKKIAEALRMKAKKMEESEHAQHINPKDLKQLAKDAAALEKAAEKLKAAFDKKFNKKEKAPAAKAEKVEALQEGTFDLKKFLVENKLTTNSRIQE